MDKDEGAIFFIGLVVGLAVGGIVMGWLVLGPMGKEYTEFRTEAIKRGYAEWTVNQETGEATWGWKE